MKTRQFLSLISLMLTVSFITTSCGPGTEEITLDQYNIKMTVPKNDLKVKFEKLKNTDYDTNLSNYDFYIAKRVTVTEIVKKVFPDNLAMLKEAISADKNFVDFIETKEFPNGAFGVIFKKKGSSGKEIKDYSFYYQKDGRYFKMKPIFNSDLDELDAQLAAYESMK